MFIDSHGKRWFKGNLHCHTTNSDGSRSPEEAVELYRDGGYDFLAITDHWAILPNCEGGGFLSDSGLLVLSGIEYNFGTNVRDGIFHIVGIGFESDPCVRYDSSPEEAIEKIHSAGGIASYAHPAWSMNTVEQVERMMSADMVEMYNSVSAKPMNCRPYSGDVLDKLAARGHILPIVAADDTHLYEFELCHSAVYVQADELTVESVMAALRKGDFIATEGPIFSVERIGDEVIYRFDESEEIERVCFFNDLAWCDDRCITGKNLTEVRYKFGRGETFMRAEIESRCGKTAWARYEKA